MITRDEHFIMVSVMINIAGYPFTSDGIYSLGFPREEGHRMYNLLINIDQKDNKSKKKYYELDSKDKKIVLSSFDLFLKEIDEHEIGALTSHTKPEIKAFYEKLKEMWK